MPRLRAAEIVPRNCGGGLDSGEPVLIAQMPAASVYVDDPDGHALAFVCLLPDAQTSAGLAYPGCALAPWWGRDGRMVTGSPAPALRAIRGRLACDTDRGSMLDRYQQLSPQVAVADAAQALGIWQDLLARPGVTGLIADHDGQASATCTVVVVPNLTRGGRPYPLIETVVTHSSRRGQGYGRVLRGGAALEAALIAGVRGRLLRGPWDIVADCRGKHRPQPAPGALIDAASRSIAIKKHASRVATDPASDACQ